MNIFMRFPGGKCKAVTLSYDDGVVQDIRLIEIMRKHGLKGTFNLNSGGYPAEGTVYPPDRIHRRLTKQEATKLYTDSGMEVAVHGMEHPFLEQLPVHLCMKDVAMDRENLEEQFGTIIRGMAYPYGRYNDDVVACLKSIGIVYSRTTITTGDFRIPTDWLRLTSTCHHNDARLMDLAKKFVENKDGCTPLLFYLWGHSYEFDNDKNWHVIENFAEYIGGKDDVWYATNIEIYEYVEAYRKLVFSMDGNRVMNPTGYTIYFQKGKKLVCVKPGETIQI